MSEVKVNKISPRTNCGTVQLGDSGDTITIPAGATITNNGTQTGFGRTGTVNWDTTVKTASFTAVSGDGYFVNTTSGAITVTLPASPSAGDIVAIADYAGTSATNNITIARNGSPFQGGSVNGVISTNRQTVTVVYIDGTQGWLPVNSNDQGFENPAFVTATGGTITTCGDFKIHTFTSPGTFCVSCAGNPKGSNSVDYLVSAGGGSGGRGFYGGGGGAGGFRYSASTYCSPSCAPGHPLRSPTGISVTATGFPITVGGGGAVAPSKSDPAADGSGSNSVFSTITSAGGGGGGNRCGPNCTAGAPGGSGGGHGDNSSPTTATAGNTPPVCPPQGQPGGAQAPGSDRYGMGGGGAIQAGETSPSPNYGGGYGGDGAGLPTAFGSNGQPISSFRYYSGGGGGGSRPDKSGGPGGDGGGGNGGQGTTGTAGTANTGGGGGGGGVDNCAGGAGGSGIVVIRYKFQ